MTPTEQIDTKELRKLAEAATPGPWIAGSPIPGLVRFLVADCGPIGKVYPADQKPSHGTTSMDDAKFIAAANPAAILALLDDRDEWRERALRAEAALAPFAAAYTPDGEHDTGMREFLDRNTITPSMTVGDFRRAYEAASGRSEVAAGAVLEGWHIEEKSTGTIIVRHDKIGGYAAREDDNDIASNILWALAKAMLAAAPSAPVAAQAEPVEVRVRDGRVWIVKGNQSFMLAYDDDDAEEREWYADHLRAVLSSITPDVKIVTPPAPMQEAGKDALDEGADILSSLMNGIEEHGNYSAESTLIFLRQLKQCIEEARAIATSKEEA